LVVHSGNWKSARLVVEKSRLRQHPPTGQFVSDKASLVNTVPKVGFKALQLYLLAVSLHRDLRLSPVLAHGLSAHLNAVGIVNQAHPKGF
jgi:hypothetical protein